MAWAVWAAWICNPRLAIGKAWGRNIFRPWLFRRLNERLHLVRGVAFFYLIAVGYDFGFP